MKIAVHFDKNDHKDSYASRWILALRNKKIDVKKVMLRSTDAIHQVKDCDGVMWHWFHTPKDKQSAPKILQAIEIGLNIPTFPNINTSWHYDEKVAQNYFFDAIDAPKVPTWVFWNYDEAKKFIEKCSYPVIFKLSVGAGSSNVLKLNNKTEANKILCKIFQEGFFPYTMNEFEVKLWPTSLYGIFQIYKRVLYAIKYITLQKYPQLPNYYLPQKNYAYFQVFLPNNKNDIRITVIGNRAFGFIRYNRPNDFRASGSENFNSDPANIPIEAVKIAHKISHKHKFQSMAYDFLKGANDEILLVEISYCYANWVVQDCKGYWDRNLNWHEEQVWPENAHVEDFINMILKKTIQTK